MSKVIEALQKPTLIMAPNKTLAAQLYGEMKSLFPNNAVEYFVSYYDYYTREAYVPRSDTYIEKESSINEQIDRLRHSATRSLIERKDTIIVASVSCIYGIGSVETYSSMSFTLEKNQNIERDFIIRKLVELLYKRRDMDFKRGSFRVKGDILEIFPSHFEDRSWKISMFGDEIEMITEVDPLTGEKLDSLDKIRIFANSHYVTPKPTIKKAITQIKEDLKQQLVVFETENKLLEKQRLDERTNFDLEMLETTGSCSGIENYSRYLSGRKPGEPPPTLYEYIPRRFSFIY
jgi:Helicase subunit of the DNA excision repair complex